MKIDAVLRLLPAISRFFSNTYLLSQSHSQTAFVSSEPFPEICSAYSTPERMLFEMLQSICFVTFFLQTVPVFTPSSTAFTSLFETPFSFFIYLSPDICLFGLIVYKTGSFIHLSAVQKKNCSRLSATVQ